MTTDSGSNDLPAAAPFAGASLGLVELLVFGIVLAGASASTPGATSAPRGNAALGKVDPSTQTVRSTGALEGTVTLAGDTLPSSTRVVNSTDPDVCGREHDLRDLVVSRGTRGVRYVIASLTGVPEDAIPERSPERLVIDNRDCQFLPHASAITVGDTVVARNSDGTLHNTHYYGPMRSNIALAEQGMTAARVARRSGLVTVLCDVHGWMTAYIRIDPHPFHDVTDADGRFRIEGVPPGSYTLELWHEKLGTREVEVEIDADGVSTVEVELPMPSD